MDMSDYIFEALQDMDSCKAEYYSPNPATERTEFDRRYDEPYRFFNNGMRILRLLPDQVQDLKDFPFLNRAMEILRENDPRPWEVLREEPKVELQRPVLIPPDDQGRKIDLESSTGSCGGSCSAIPDDKGRQIHIPDSENSASEPRDQRRDAG
jgi:hypothetical protein